MSILVTGATGYIGSHVTLELLRQGYDAILLDNLTNSKKEVINRIKDIVEKEIVFYNIDLLNNMELESVFKENDIKAVIHLAGFKSVAESVANPIKYYKNNVVGLLNLCSTMEKYKVRNIVFSSSATVYGNNNISPMTEDMVLSPINPYGSTKLVCEQILKELYSSDNRWSVEILRYFNPVGAHQSGFIGEEPSDKPTNLMPIITGVAIGRIPKLFIFGDNYNTEDGTGIRDYIHVVDLAKAHIKALEKNLTTSGANIYNIGTGKGYSVLELVKTFEKVTGCIISYEIVDRRAGDVDICFADSSKAVSELRWKAEKNIEEMCLDAWRWEESNRQMSGCQL